MAKIQIITVTREDAGIRLDRWFKRHFPAIGHITLEKALRKGYVKVDGHRAKAGLRVEAGQTIKVPPLAEKSDEPGPVRPQKIPVHIIESMRESILYKDDDILVINKPAGLAVQGGNKVTISVDAVLEHMRLDRVEKPKLVHRLDKDTSGVLLLARSSRVAAELTRAFQDKTIDKTYLAITVGVPKPLQGVIDKPLLKQQEGRLKEKVLVDEEEGQRAITEYRVIDHAGETLALVELKPITGRTHQLRVHMLEKGTPILGDGKYGAKKAFIEGLGNKLHLHAYSIILPDGKKITAPLPEHIKKTCKEMGLEA